MGYSSLGEQASVECYQERVEFVLSGVPPAGRMVPELIKRHSNVREKPRKYSLFRPGGWSGSIHACKKQKDSPLVCSYPIRTLT